ALAPAVAAAPSATDNCTASPTIHVVSRTEERRGTCANAYVRTRVWNFDDGCGNTSANFTQTITVIDNSAPVVTTAAGSLDATVQCSDSAGLAAAVAAAPRATDNCTASPTIHVVSDTTAASGTCANAYVRTRVWSLDEDSAEIRARVKHIIRLLDNSAPVVTTAAGSLDATVQIGR